MFKTGALLLTPLLWVLSSGNAFAQGTFRNLDFEGADVFGYSPGTTISAVSALPGWTVSFSPGLGQVWYDGVSLGGALVSVSDAQTPYLGDKAVLDGTYSAFLFGGAYGPATISQTGVVPGSARSLQLWVGNFVNTEFSVSLGGQPIPMTALATYPNYTLYGGDISSLAGQTATLSLTAPVPPSTVVPPSWFQVDNINFSPQIVPEPGALPMFCFFLALFAKKALNRITPRRQAS